MGNAPKEPVEWNYRRERAEKAVPRSNGVKGITNSLRLQPRVTLEVKSKTHEAFTRNAGLGADKIIVETSGGEVIVHRSVRSCAEREEAERLRGQRSGSPR